MPQPVKKPPQRNWYAEGLGWWQMLLLMFLFPALFFACVWFPIWVGWTEPFP